MYTIEHVYDKYWSDIIVWDFDITHDEVSSSNSQHKENEDVETHSRVAAHRRKALERDDQTDEWSTGNRKTYLFLWTVVKDIGPLPIEIHQAFDGRISPTMGSDHNQI